jgi:hypothetical protein
MLADALGNVWLRQHPRAAVPDPPWQVFRPDGAWLGAVQLPAFSRPLEIGEDYGLVLTDDEAAGHVVAVHTLRRNPTPR